MIRILIAGDTCPTNRNELLFRNGDVPALLNDLQPEFETADLAIINLECPLIQSASPIDKCGPHLGAPLECVNGLKAMGIHVVALANNHCMDHGPEGLCSTMRVLDEYGIDYVGAGENLAAARKILVREVHGVRIGIMALAEHEFGFAEEAAPGANPLDIMDVVRDATANRDGFDFLIVLFHGGNESYPYPRPRLMDTCRFLIEQGAAAVICQHSHCAGCMETYREAPIIYGQGNFLFDYHSKSTGWHDGVLVSLQVNGKACFDTQLIPYRQSDGQPGVRRMTPEEEQVFMADFVARSLAIGDRSFVATRWEAFCRENRRAFLQCLHGKPGFLRRVASKLDLLRYFDSREVQRRRLHFVRCESLREALITVLTQEAERR